MSNPKFTPGPWVIGKWTILPEDRDERGYGLHWTLIACEPDDFDSTVSAGPVGRKAKESDPNCWPTGYEADGVEMRPEDMRLIAATPEMADTLARILAWIDAGCDPSAAVIAKARALLAKIDGEETT